MRIKWYMGERFRTTTDDGLIKWHEYQENVQLCPPKCVEVETSNWVRIIVVLCKIWYIMYERMHIATYYIRNFQCCVGISFPTNEVLNRTNNWSIFEVSERY